MTAIRRGKEREGTESCVRVRMTEMTRETMPETLPIALGKEWISDEIRCLF